MKWLRGPVSVAAFLGAFLAALLGLLASPALAAVPTLNFTVGTNGQPVPAPAPFRAVKAIYTEMLSWRGHPLGQLQGVQDIYIDNTPQHNLWIVDTGGNRIIELAANPNALGQPQYNKVVQVIGWPNATGPYKLNAPQGVAVGPDGVIYVADTGNDRIAAFAPNGTFLKTLNTGTSLSFRAQKIKFVPQHIAVDSRNTIYVVIAGQPYGLARFDSQGKFLGFFAPNAVGFNVKFKLQQLLETRAQRKQNAKLLPPEVNNAYVGPDGYIYTTSIDVSSKQIRRLNVAGADTLNTMTIQYGLPISALPDYVFQNIISQAQSNQSSGSGGQSGPLSLQPRFVSIAASKTGLITALDQLTNYVFQYGREGQLLYTFGGLDTGNGVLGLFEDPTAVAVAPGGDVLVSDMLEQNVTLFQPTKFALLVQQGVRLYNQGHYRQAEKPWKQVLAFDTNYDLAHAQLSQGYLAQGQILGGSPSVYQQQLHYFSKAIAQAYLANSKPAFGLAFGWYRHIWMRVNFTWVFLSFLGAWLVIYLLVKVLGKRLRERPIAFEGAWVRNQFVRIVPMAWRMIKHPAETLFQLKYEDQGTLWQGLVLIGAALVLHVANLAFTNFDFSPLVRGQTNMLVTAAQFLLPLATWIVANYLVGDLYEGEANLAEIITGSAYALMPFIVLQLPFALLTHALAPTDGLFTFLLLGEKVWVLYLFFTQVRVLHNLDWGQAIKASALSLVGIGVIWTMFLIVFGLAGQAVAFVHQIIQEAIMLRS